jgi:hypothetical protein
MKICLSLEIFHKNAYPSLLGVILMCQLSTTTSFRFFPVIGGEIFRDRYGIQIRDPYLLTRTQLIAPLTPEEQKWRELQPILQAHGYTLRARYHPDWKPSPYINYHAYTSSGHTKCFFVSDLGSC